MKQQILIALLLLCACFQASAQNINVPDDDLILYFNNTGYSGCLTGNSINLSCPAVINTTKINLTGYAVSDINVLTSFPNLDTLIANYCDIEFINSSFLSNLQYLDLSFNQINSLPSLPQSLEYLNVQYNQLSSLEALPLSLKYLNCRGNAIQALPALPQSLILLDCAENQITTLPNLNSNLQQLNAGTNLLTSAPYLGLNNLRRIWLNNNQLSSITALPDSLRYLNISHNQIDFLDPIDAIMLDTFLLSNNLFTTIPGFNGRVKLLDFSYNFISEIPVLPSMTGNCKIYGSHNDITSLSALPLLLTYLDISHNPGLASLIALPSGLNYLNCSYCNLNIINSLPTELGTLQCSKNPLTGGINSLPPSLISLYADSCQLYQLPSLPQTLNRLQAKGNVLTELINLPSGLRYLNVSDNDLTQISSASTSYYQFLVDRNQDLFCLPPIFDFLSSNAGQYSIAETGITCLPNVIQYSFTSAMFDTLPLCGMFNNPSNCQIYWNIAGQVFLDANNDCNQDVSEAELNSIKVMLRQGGVVVQQAFTNANGLYSFNTDLTEYEVLVDTLDLPFIPVCPDGNLFIVNPGGTSDTLVAGINFGLICEPGMDIAGLSMAHASGLFFPLQVASLAYSCGDLAGAYGATCNTAGVSGSIKFTLEGPGEFFNPITQTTLGDTLVIPVNDWGSLDYNQARFLHVQTDMSPIPGEYTTIRMQVFADSGFDVQPANDTLLASYEVVNSYDPNYKEVFPSQIGNGGEWHYYTIHFQNTGTAPAINIVVKDTLSSFLDWNSFKRLASSHYNITQVFEDGEVHFTFPNIMLADSASDPEGSQGWIQFKIKTISDIPGEFLEIPNRASIYFDFNDPVNTEYCHIRYCLPMNRSQSITICEGDSFQVGLKWYNHTGMFRDSLLNIYGCDSLVFTSLYVRNSFSPDTLEISECTGNSFNYGTQQFDQPGLYSISIPTGIACDSVFLLSLNWVDPGPLEELVYLCGNDSFIVEGITYYDSDTVTYVLNDFGCSYTLTYYLMHEENPEIFVQISDGIVEVNSGFSSYQWYDCVTGNSIPGETGTHYNPQVSGMYAVRVTTLSGCEYSSECEPITILSLPTALNQYLSISPNPANSICHVSIPDDAGVEELIITDLSGRIVYSKNVTGLETIPISVDYLSPGIYCIQARGHGINSIPAKLMID